MLTKNNDNNNKCDTSIKNTFGKNHSMKNNIR